MRNYKYRGKRIDNGQWIEGYPWIVPGVEFYYILTGKINLLDITIEKYEVIPESIGEYTGLKDKNNKEIYEGDIIDLTYFMTKKIGIVKFGKYKQCDMESDYECGNQGFYIEVENDKYNAWRPDIWFYHSNCKVIGNIYENPEILDS